MAHTHPVLYELCIAGFFGGVMAVIAGVGLLIRRKRW